MKNLFFIFFCSFAIIATAQFRVQDNGIGAFGNLPSYFNAKSNLQDSVSSCCFFSPVQNAKARIAIGKYFAGKTPGIYIGEHTQNAMMLNLYGMLGFNFSFLEMIQLCISIRKRENTCKLIAMYIHLEYSYPQTKDLKKTFNKSTIQ